MFPYSKLSNERLQELKEIKERNLKKIFDEMNADPNYTSRWQQWIDLLASKNSEISMVDKELRRRGL